MKKNNNLDNVENLIRFNNDIPIIKIEEFMEYLEDDGLLNMKGRELRASLWSRYIKE